MPSTDVLTVSGLRIELPASGARRPILDGIDLVVRQGETVALVGESGSGKSVTARAVLGMYPPQATVAGSIEVAGREVIGASSQTTQDLRRHHAAMVFQDPRSSANPLNKVRKFLTEGLIARGTPASEALSQCRALLESVGIRDIERVLDSYPHQLSGGMLQRIMISVALSGDPQLLLADEPTTALDVTTQAEVISILEARRAASGAAMLFVTHNLDLAAAISSRIYVMYAGRIVEHGDVERVFNSPRHPYTRALFAATPKLDGTTHVSAIPGKSLSLAEEVNGCVFAHRCPFVTDRCLQVGPPLRHVDGTEVACVRAEELLPA